MKLRCSVCDNTSRFTAEAKANVFVVIDGEGKIINPRTGQTPVTNIVVLKPWKYNSCGAVDRIQDLDSGEKK